MSAQTHDASVTRYLYLSSSRPTRGLVLALAVADDEGKGVLMMCSV
jgi:hypothetical protein